MRYSDDSGHWELNSFPGCNQIVVSNHAYVKPAYRGNGVGRECNIHRINQATELGYDLMLCTVKSVNTIQIRILQRNGWRMLDSFLNRESGNQVELWSKSLHQN